MNLIIILTKDFTKIDIHKKTYRRSYERFNRNKTIANYRRAIKKKLAMKQMEKLKMQIVCFVQKKQ